MGAGASFIKRMSLLFTNDEKGVYPQSWYAATCDLLPVFDPLSDSQRFDVCVIGAGYTGLSTSLHLAEAGYKVVVLEAQRIGFGASGRNGGQIGSGQRLEQGSLIKVAGAETADLLWKLAEESKATVKSLIQKHQIDCYLKSGIADLGLNQPQMKDMHHYTDFLAERYGYDHIIKLDKDAAYALCPSLAYHGGYLDQDAGHLHPLRYAIGLAEAALTAGVKIFENTEVTSLDKGERVKVHTSDATITCDYAVLACNGYLGNLEPSVASRVMPINNFIAATEPLGTETAKVLSAARAGTRASWVATGAPAPRWRPGTRSPRPAAGSSTCSPSCSTRRAPARASSRSAPPAAWASSPSSSARTWAASA